MKGERPRPQPTVTTGQVPAPDAQERLRRAFGLVLEASARGRREDEVAEGIISGKGEQQTTSNEGEDNV